MKTLIPAKNPKFPLGQLVITANAHAQIGPEDVQQAITRHLAGDWGDIGPDDAKTNEEALRHGFRLLSEYTVGTKRFWVITESDRSLTTVLMPEDY